MSKGETLYVLHETASGYALFDVVELDEVRGASPLGRPRPPPFPPLPLPPRTGNGRGGDPVAPS